MKKILATLLIFSIFIGYSAKTNAKDNRDVLRITVYEKDGGAYRLFMGIRYSKVKTTFQRQLVSSCDCYIDQYQVTCEGRGWEKCRRGPTEYSPNLNISNELSTLFDNIEDQMLTSIEEQIQNGKTNGTMVRKINQKTNGITKTYQIAIEWKNCDNSEYGGTIVSKITDITNYMPTTTTNATNNNALSH